MCLLLPINFSLVKLNGGKYWDGWAQGSHLSEVKGADCLICKNINLQWTPTHAHPAWGIETIVKRVGKDWIHAELIAVSIKKACWPQMLPLKVNCRHEITTWAVREKNLLGFCKRHVALKRSVRIRDAVMIKEKRGIIKRKCCGKKGRHQWTVTRVKMKAVERG